VSDFAKAEGTEGSTNKSFAEMETSCLAASLIEPERMDLTNIIGLDEDSHDLASENEDTTTHITHFLKVNLRYLLVVNN
jgi:hypothetical protein